MHLNRAHSAPISRHVASASIHDALNAAAGCGLPNSPPSLDACFDNSALPLHSAHVAH